MYIYIYAYVYMYICICIYVYMYICICICMFYLYVQYIIDIPSICGISFMICWMYYPLLIRNSYWKPPCSKVNSLSAGHLYHSYVKFPEGRTVHGVGVWLIYDWLHPHFISLSPIYIYIYIYLFMRIYIYISYSIYIYICMSTYVYM